MPQEFFANLTTPTLELVIQELEANAAECPTEPLMTILDWIAEAKLVLKEKTARNPVDRKKKKPGANPGFFLRIFLPGDLIPR